MENTFMFCTSFVNNGVDLHSASRYNRWANFYLPLLENLEVSHLFLIDDGGKDNITPAANILQGVLPDTLTDAINIYRFDATLGRNDLVDFPGWWRSFLFAIDIARKYGFRKMVHIESDFFMLSARLRNFVRDTNTGWTGLYSPHYNFPEPAFQIICEDAFEAFDALKDTVQGAGYHATEFAEGMIPFTAVRRDFIGDRLGEEMVLSRWIDHHASSLAKLDFIAQVGTVSDVTTPILSLG